MRHSDVKESRRTLYQRKFCHLKTDQYTSEHWHWMQTTMILMCAASAGTVMVENATMGRTESVSSKDVRISSAE